MKEFKKFYFWTWLVLIVLVICELWETSDWEFWVCSILSGLTIMGIINQGK